MKPRESHHLIVSVPWPVRLFGEGMEHFGLPALSVALNLRTAIRVSKREDDRCSIHGHRLDTPIAFEGDLNQMREIDITSLSLAASALHASDTVLKTGYDFEIFTLVPETEDLLNSPALLVAWITTFLTLSEQVKDKSGNQLADMACAALEEGPGHAAALADIHACVLGGTVFMRDPRVPVVEQIDRTLSGLVYAYPKNRTAAPLSVATLRERTHSAVAAATNVIPGFSLTQTPLNDLLPKLNAHELTDFAGLLYALLSNRDDCCAAHDLLEREYGLDDDRIGELMDRTHEMFRDYLGLDSPERESLIARANEAGALGSIPSACSNSVLTFAGGHQDDVIAALREADATALPVEISEGVSVGS